MKEISTYMSDDLKKESTVFFIKEPRSFKVVVKSDSGSTFSTSFDNLTTAEEYAEDWVLAK